jgi:small-conductance mechanosensitive channel
MYLDFILDIAKVGDIINITTKEQNIEGEIMKISSSLIAVKKANGSVVVCKDEDITDFYQEIRDQKEQDLETLSEEEEE